MQHNGESKIKQQIFEEKPQNLRRIKDKARRFTENQWRKDEESCCNKLSS